MIIIVTYYRAIDISEVVGETEHVLIALGGRRKQIKDELPGNLRRLRRRKSLTQQELSRLVGYTRAYISRLEKGTCDASMAVLKKLSKALEVSVAHLLATPETSPGLPADTVKTAILNDPSSEILISPIKDSPVQDGFLMPSLRARDSFALYLPDDSMAPEFGKGDLVVFSLSRKPADGQACLVDRGKGPVLFRTVLALPGKQWRLQPSNPKFAPILVRGKGIRIWPAVGHWRMLGSAMPSN